MRKFIIAKAFAVNICTHCLLIASFLPFTFVHFTYFRRYNAIDSCVRAFEGQGAGSDTCLGRILFPAVSMLVHLKEIREGIHTLWIESSNIIPFTTNCIIVIATQSWPTLTVFLRRLCCAPRVEPGELAAANLLALAPQAVQENANFVVSSY